MNSHNVKLNINLKLIVSNKIYSYLVIIITERSRNFLENVPHTKVNWYYHDLYLQLVWINLNIRVFVKDVQWSDYDVWKKDRRTVHKIAYIHINEQSSYAKLSRHLVSIIWFCVISTFLCRMQGIRRLSLRKRASANFKYQLNNKQSISLRDYWNASDCRRSSCETSGIPSYGEISRDNSVVIIWENYMCSRYKLKER